jgi:nuclear pore complex protein Nup62
MHSTLWQLNIYLVYENGPSMISKGLILLAPSQYVFLFLCWFDRHRSPIDVGYIVCMYGCMYIYVNVYICVYVCMYVSLAGWMDGWMHACMYIYIYVYIYMYIYICGYGYITT